LAEKRLAIEHVDAVVIFGAAEVGATFPKMMDALAKSLGVAAEKSTSSENQ